VCHTYLYPMGTPTLVSVAKTTSLFGNEQIGLSVWKRVVIRILASSAAVIFGGAILVMSILAASDPVRVRPNTEPLDSMVVASVEAKPKIEYYLPYPGLLPDSPLYKLKAARDRVTLWLTWTAEGKARKELLFADKRVNAGVVLIEGGKSELGVTTITKAEKYMESAVVRVEKEMKSGKDVKSVAIELSKALPKHIEVIADAQMKVSEWERESLIVSQALAEVLKQRIDQVLREAR